jgi:hypothetical protein
VVLEDGIGWGQVVQVVTWQVPPVVMPLIVQVNVADPDAPVLSVAVTVTQRDSPPSQLAVKSWLVPAAFLHGHWSYCWPRLLPAP